MNSAPHIFNSKLLLFGEYGLMYNAMALSLPFSRYYGSLEFDSSHLHMDSTSEIRKFHAYLNALDKDSLLHPLNLKALKEDLERGLYFNSNIPLQYGLGSSGALVAALFNRFAASAAKKEKLGAEKLKVDFALMESYFHGKSSGLDPLVSFLNRPLLLNADKTIQSVPFELFHAGVSIALIDTKTTGATGPLVQHFMDRMKLPDFKKTFQREFIASGNGCIQSLLFGDLPLFFLFLKQLIQFQLQNLDPMIPPDFKTLIGEALDDQVYIKLLGSGGGGFLLAFAASPIKLQQWAENKAVQLIKVA